ncbi:MAG: putative zinc-binding metallopeptidase [Caulobacteraceae bacterium]
MPRTGARASGRRRNTNLADMSDRDLLALPIKDLKLSLGGSWLGECLDELNAELAQRDIRIRIHGWLSDEWFSPPETPGIAFPFYLAHPRLMRLERKMMLEVEGGTRRECMRLLRHEAGHVVQYGFGLHRRRRWQTLFGRASKPYPEHYKANPTSKRYVQYLRRWYAQCHPDEDFAETFAVWLTPRYNWRKRYQDWPALQKLEYVDKLMHEIAGQRAAPQKRIRVDPVSKLKGTLSDHYEQKRERYEIDTPTVFDRDLRRIFSDDPRYKSAPRAGAIIRRNRARIVRSVSRWTGEYPVALDAALHDMMTRCRALSLKAPGSDAQIRLEITAMLSSKAVYQHYSSTRRHWFAV